MKRVFIVVFAIFPLLVMAQDVIVTVDENRLEDITIVAVTDLTVDYIVNGSSFSINKDSVNAILYSDGRYVQIPHNANTEIISEAPKSNPNENGVPNEITNLSYPEKSINSYTTIQQENMGSMSAGIVHGGHNDYWQKNFVMECAGWGMLAGGVLFFSLSFVPMWPNYGAAYASLGLGCACMVSGVTLGTIGCIRRTRNAQEKFYGQCATESQLTFKLQTDQNGLGLAVNF